MAGTRLPLLRGRITSVDTYEAPQQGSGVPPAMPSLDPKAHRSALLQQLDAITQQVSARAETARDELAKREIVAVRPAANAQLAADQLDDSKADARLVGVMPETGTVLLDVAGADLGYLREKIEAFADDSKVIAKTKKDGSPKLDEHGVRVTARASEKAIAPVGSIGLAQLEDVGDGQRQINAIPADRACWFEIGCRGGYRYPGQDTINSRAQIARQLHRLGVSQKLDEFLGPEQVYFFVRVTRAQLAALHAATDCIYDVDLAPQPLRDLKLLDDLETKDIANFELTRPHEDAPSVVVLDTGIATGHPLLKSAILTATTAGPEIPSPEDTHGHGTRMAGLALYRDVGAAIERGSAEAPHWLQSSRLLIHRLWHAVRRELREVAGPHRASGSRCRASGRPRAQPRVRSRDHAHDAGPTARRDRADAVEPGRRPDRLQQGTGAAHDPLGGQRALRAVARARRAASAPAALREDSPARAGCECADRRRVHRARRAAEQQGLCGGSRRRDEAGRHFAVHEHRSRRTRMAHQARRRVRGRQPRDQRYAS